MSKGKHFFTIPPFSLYLHTTRSGITKTNYLYMKKYLIPILAVLCASLSLSAQEANREITAQLAESYAELQSTYTPSFKVVYDPKDPAVARDPHASVLESR